MKCEALEEKKKIILYHGSNSQVVKPNIGFSQFSNDFGVGFYLTDNADVAKKYAARFVQSYLNVYQVDLNNLKIKYLEVNDEWLQYVLANDVGSCLPSFNDQDYDVITGPCAEDFLNVICYYSWGVIDKKQVFDIIKSIGYTNQVVFKKQESLDKYIHFGGFRTLLKNEQVYWREKRRDERKRGFEMVKKQVRCCGDIMFREVFD